MPTPRKSIAELKLTGTFQQNKARYQTRLSNSARVISPLGTVPKHMTSPERAVWAEIVRSVPAGLLSRSDRSALEVLVQLTLKMRTGTAKVGEINLLMTILTKFGMTPTSRRRMHIEPPVEVDDTPETKSAWEALDELD